MARTANRRRLAVFSIALATALASVALTTGPASATTVSYASCLDAHAQQVYDGGAVIQWGCDSNDPYQDWTGTFVTDSPYGALYQLQNVGALDNNGAADCLDADAGQVYDGGAIIQWGCDPTDPYQLWIINNIGVGAWSLQNYGALIQQDAADCLDADANGALYGGAIIQWGCNTSDLYQTWQTIFGPNGSFAYENIGTAVNHGGGV